MPFISPYPIGSDVQPVAVFFASLLIFWTFLERNFYLSFLGSFFLLLGFFSLIYQGFDVSNIYEIRTRVGLIFAAITFVAMINYFDYFSPRVLMLAIFVNLFGVIWHFIHPDSFLVLGEIIVREIKSAGGGRGSSGFAAESSFTSITAMVQLIVGYFFYLRNKIGLSSFRWAFLLCSTVIVLSGSGTGIIYAAFLISIYLLSKISLRTFVTSLLILPILIFGFLNSSIPEQTRGGYLLKLVLTNPLIIFRDGSVAERMLSIEIGLRGFQLHPLGAGGGSYSNVAKEVDSKFNLLTKYESFGVIPVRGNAYLKETVSSFAKYLIELGIIFLFFILLILYSCFANNSFNLISLSLALLLMLVSFSILFPPTYLLLACCISNKRPV